MPGLLKKTASLNSGSRDVFVDWVPGQARHDDTFYHSREKHISFPRLRGKGGWGSFNRFEQAQHKVGFTRLDAVR